jgi:hypothetical protein
MNYSIDDIMNLANEISQFSEISTIDIPYIDLYMDQITTLFEDKLSHLKRNKEETILTKTMINNYAKAKILTPIKNKKYNKQQIILLILIYNLKQILSLEDIKLLLTPIINELNNPDSTFKLEELYENFLDIKKDQNSSFASTFMKDANFVPLSVNLKETEAINISDLVLLILTLVSSATLQKRMSEKLIDDFFKNTLKD